MRTVTGQEGTQHCVIALGRADVAEVVALARVGAQVYFPREMFLALEPARLSAILAALPFDAAILAGVAPHEAEPALRGETRIEWLLDDPAEPGVSGGRCWVQVRSVERLLELNLNFPAAKLPYLAGYILVGAEAGGIAGSQSTFVQMQRLAAAGWAQIARRPLLVRGGVGLYSAPACALAGAAGVVLDDQLSAWPQGPLDLPARLRETLEGTELIAVGEPLGFPVRVLVHPAAPGGRALETLALELEARAGAENQDAAQLHNTWITRAKTELARRDGGAPLLLGQGAGLSAALRRVHPRLPKLARAVFDAPRQFAQNAAKVAEALAPQGPLAASHGTLYPIVQGPMTRVSDIPEFAAAIAANGALPMLALALLPGERVAALLDETARVCAGRPWGVGLLGFADAPLLAAQISEVRRCKPAFALIAGGRADQAHSLEQDGIAAYVHAPTPRRARALVEQGVSRIVLEGRECGGHVGPLHSFVLWEGVVHELLATPPACGYEKLHVLLAGGIHDDISAMLAMAVLAPLIERGVKAGVLMGTAYLTCDEAVESGAITETFRQAVLESCRTVNLESGRGHAVRCLDTPFAHVWSAARVRLAAAATPAETFRAELDELALGRLRLASKGLERSAGQLLEVPAERQLADGMYMAGEVATLLCEQTTLGQLHERVSVGGAALLTTYAEADAPLRLAAEPLDIAIVGIAMQTPGGGDPGEFWRCLLSKEVHIDEIPRDRWDWRLLFEENPQKGAEACSGRWGGLIQPFIFEPLRYGVPPKAVTSISPAQLIALDVARRALDDAGWNDGNGFPREDTAVIAACSDVAGFNGNKLVMSACAPFLLDPDSVERLRERVPKRTEETFPGSLNSVTAGRIANRLDLGGPNLAVDSACASSLSALAIATAELAAGRCKAAVVAGADVSLTPDQFVNFSTVGALSKTGRIRAFDSAADGTVLGEGVVGLVLRPLADAERAGERIYAVIRAVGGSSDGRSLGMTAPRPLGQRRAVRRAYDIAGFPISRIGLYEAHGTGTQVGDRAELETITSELLAHAAHPESVLLGSAKAQLGHIKTAAGLAGISKAALALYHQTLPPQAAVDNPIAPLTQADCPVFLAAAPLPWFRPVDAPRRAGVSAFGFGGTNAHAVLEEYQNGAAAPLGAAEWPRIPFVASAADAAALLGEVRKLQRLAARAELALPAIAAAAARRVAEQPRAEWALALAAGDRAELLRSLENVAGALEKGSAEQIPNVWFGPCRAAREGRLVFLFPGQGSQRPHMGREAAVYLEPFRRVVEEAVQTYALAHPAAIGLDRLIYPPAAFNAELEQRFSARLTDTRAAQIAIGAISAAWLRVLETAGIHADFLAGHSYGEFTALYAAGCYDLATLFGLSLQRGAAMHSCGAGAMTAVLAERSAVTAVLAGLDAKVVIANHNAPAQVVLSGSVADIEAAETALQAAALNFRRLPVSGAFHSPYVASAQETLATRIAGVAFRAAALPVYGNADGQPYPADAQEANRRLQAHMTAAVEFVAQIENLYAAGARCFVEVGPGAVLTRLVGKILPDRGVTALALDETPEMGGLLGVLGQLWLAGEDVAWENLLPESWYVSSLEGLLEQPAPQIPATAWWVGGQDARPVDEQSPLGESGVKPQLDFEEAQKMREEAGRTPQPADTAAPAAPPATDMVRLVADFQDTMRVFLSSQERILMAALGAAPASGAICAASLMPSMPVAVSVPQVAAPPLAATPAAIPAPAPAAAPVLDRAALAALVREVVASCSGYPESVLSPKHDLESELGIDSIKRVEIVEEIQRRLPPGQFAQLAGRSGELSRAKTLDQITDILSAVSGGVAAVPAPASAAPATLSAAELGDVVRRVVSELTGYPAQLLGANQDMEADLGIDSIKRVEIAELIVRNLPAQFAERLRSRPDALARAKRLQDIDAILAGLLDDAPPAAPLVTSLPPAAVAADEPETPPQYDDSCPGYTVVFEPAPLSPLPLTSPLAGKRVLVAEGDPALTHAVITHLRDLGVNPVVLPWALACRAGEVDKFLANGAVDAVLQLSPTRRPGHSALDSEAWMQAALHAVLPVAQHCAPRWTEPVSWLRWLTVTATGGAPGQNGAPEGESALLQALGGGVAGMLRCLHIEHPGATVRIADLPVEWDTALAAQTIVAELHAATDQETVSWLDGERKLMRLAAWESAPVEPGEAFRHILAIGGIRGITAHCLLSLAGPQTAISIIARGEPALQEDPASAAIPDMNGLRAYFAAALAQEGQAPQARDIERHARSVFRDRAARAALAKLREAGSTVTVFAADALDRSAVAAAIHAAQQQNGAPDCVVHGAGIIEDKRLIDKKPESWRRVIDTKLYPVLALGAHLETAKLRKMVFFGSVAGSIGNLGQSDYALANEALNFAGKAFAARWPGVSVSTINWGPWAGLGMASDAVNQQFAERGIKTIQPAAGAAFFSAAVWNGPLQLVAGAGYWETA